MTTTIAVFNQPGLNGGGVGNSGDENSNLLSIIQNEIANGKDNKTQDAMSKEEVGTPSPFSKITKAHPIEGKK